MLEDLKWIYDELLLKHFIPHHPFAHFTYEQLAEAWRVLEDYEEGMKA